ncbi:MAG: hypothetical protein K0Q96_808 [Rubrobacteraceae bacterium]|nr:hypothetical protein [Rubrobacteraceae bacterium]
MPDGAARVSVVGDSEFVAVALIEQLEEWSFYYVLGELIEPRGERVWL